MLKLNPITNLKEKIPSVDKYFTSTSEEKKKSVKRQATENRYELRKKKVAIRHELTSKEGDMMNKNSIKCLSGISVPLLHTYQLAHKSLHYDEVKVRESLQTLHTYWNLQSLFIQFFSKMLTSLVGFFSHREL